MSQGARRRHLSETRNVGDLHHGNGQLTVKRHRPARRSGTAWLGIWARRGPWVGVLIAVASRLHRYGAVDAGNHRHTGLAWQGAIRCLVGPTEVPIPRR